MPEVHGTSLPCCAILHICMGARAAALISIACCSAAADHHRNAHTHPAADHYRNAHTHPAADHHRNAHTQAHALLKMTPPEILRIEARQIFDSRGNPTIECDLWTHKGMFRWPWSEKRNNSIITVMPAVIFPATCACATGSPTSQHSLPASLPLSFTGRRYPLVPQPAFMRQWS